MCKAPVKLSLPTNQLPTLYSSAALPVTQPTVSEHCSEKLSDTNGNINPVCCKRSGKVNHAPQESIGGAHLPPLPGLQPVGGEPLLSVTRGQCDARPMVTFPATSHHRPLAGTKLYCLVTEAHKGKGKSKGKGAYT